MVPPFATFSDSSADRFHRGTRHVDSLKAHNKTAHDEKVPCVHCGKLYGVAARMSVHIQAQHTPNEDKKHKCEVCGKGFSESDRLKDHNNIHTGEKPYLCQFCSACFASKGTHAMHERSHLGQIEVFNLYLFVLSIYFILVLSQIKVE